MRGYVPWIAVGLWAVACSDGKLVPETYPIPGDGGAPPDAAPDAPPPPPPPPAPTPTVDSGCPYAIAAGTADGFCKPAPGDADGDGYTVADGDCNDNDCAINPGAFDIPADAIDQDCSGAADDESTACDDALALAGDDPLEAAKAIGLCRKTTSDATGKAKTWGVIAARWALPDGTAEKVALSRGVLPAFGANAPRAGARMLALSSGTARAPDQSGYVSPLGYDKGYDCTAPEGYPKAAPACPGITTGDCRDGAALVVDVRAPTNARSFGVKQNFFTFEYPDFVCSSYNDYFVTMIDPKPAGLPDRNVAFDQQGNPISVNNSLLSVCEPQTAGGKQFKCPLGSSSLQGTGFEGHAATGWVTTRAPVVRGSTVTLTFAIWDSTDGTHDSTTLIDDFVWSTAVVDCPSTTASGTK